MIYDLCIFGGGIAGTTAASLACQKGLRVLLLDPKPLGGVCLFEGCIPAKVCLSGSDNLPELCRKRENVVQTLANGLACSMAESGAEIRAEKGQLLGKTDDLFSVQCGEEIVQSRYVLLSCGSAPKKIPGTVTAEQIFSADTLPKSAVILGAGAAGLETASYLSKMGCSVTVLEQNPVLLPDAEPEIGNALLRSFRKKGIRIHLGVSVEKICENTVVTDTKTYTADAVVSAIGRSVSLPELGLDSVGLSTISVDTAMQTPVPGLYAAGDLLSHHCTAHAAVREAECAVRNICGEADRINYRIVPNVIFTNPQCAFVGETESDVLRRGETPLTAVVSLKTCGGYLAQGGDGNGILKLVASPDGTILGLHLCGGTASEIISVGTLLICEKIRADKLCFIPFPHPTVSEALHTAALMLCERIKTHDAQ